MTLDETNPYSPPRDATAPRKRRRRKRPARRAPGEAIKWIYAAFAVGNAVAFLALVSGGARRLGVSEQIVTIVDGPLPCVFPALGAAWIYYAWSGLPWELVGRITPAAAVGRLFVPVYSLYWIFAVNARLAHAVDRLLDEIHDPRRVPRTVAVVATISPLVSTVMVMTDAKADAWVAIVGTHVLWLAYMFWCDPLRRAVVGVTIEEDHADSDLFTRRR